MYCGVHVGAPSLLFKPGVTLMDHNSYGKVCLYQGMLIPRQSYYSDYAYPGGGVVV
jgi:hypothetical protein